MRDRADIRYFSQAALWKPPVAGQVRVADDLVSLVPSDVRSILDAGCGNGAVTRRLIDRWDVVACDFSEAAVQQLRGVRALLADLAGLPFADRAFDLVLASDVIEHVPDGLYQAALAEIARVAGRYVLLAVPHREILAAAEVHCPHCGHRYHAHLHQRSYDVDGMDRVFGPEFGIRRVLRSGPRWTFADPGLVRARQETSGLDYPFEDALCPRCGTRRGPVEQSRAALQAARRFEALQAMSCGEGLAPLPPKSEALVLFERGCTGPADEADEIEGREIDPSVRLAALEVHPDPIAYPPRPIRIGPVDTPTLIALPRAAQKLSVETGKFDTIEVFDFVRQQFIECRTGDGPAIEVPKAPYGPFGALLRIHGATQDLALQVEYATATTRADILALCFGDSPVLNELAGRAAESAALVESLAESRDRLEHLLQARDHDIASLSDAASRANEAANALEAKRASLDALAVGLQGERDRLALVLRAADIAERSAASALPAGLPVLVLSHMYPRSHHPAGGIFVHDQVKALRARGLDVRVMSGDPFWIDTLDPVRIWRALATWRRTGGYRWEDHDGVPLIRFPYIVSSRFLPFQAHAFTYTRAALRCLRRLTEPFEFRLVHAHTAFTDGSAGVAISKARRVPLVITEHTGPFSVLTRTGYLRRKTQAAMNAADRLIAVSPSLLADIEAQVKLKQPARAVVVPNLVDTEFFRPAPHRQDASMRALWVGHFVSVKRVDRLLSALAEAVKTEPRLQLRLVGDGELLDEMRSLALRLGVNDRVEFMGGVDRASLPAHYVNSDFVVISSDRETFGVVAIEGLSCGRPVLTTACGGPQSVITDAELGMVVEPSISGLAAGLVAMAARARAAESDLIREVAKRRFSTTAITDRVMKVYSDVLTGNG